jgi:hypothetical protein
MEYERLNFFCGEYERLNFFAGSMNVLISCQHMGTLICNYRWCIDGGLNGTIIVLLFISQDGNKEVDSVKEMLECAVRMIWDSALCYKMVH